MTDEEQPTLAQQLDNYEVAIKHYVTVDMRRALAEIDAAIAAMGNDETEVQKRGPLFSRWRLLALRTLGPQEEVDKERARYKELVEGRFDVWRFLPCPWTASCGG